MKNLRYMVVFPLLMIAVSVVTGWRCYDQAKAEMTEDLNQALQRTALTDASVEGILDSLSSMPGSPMLTFNGTHHDFANFLHIPSLRDTAHVSYSMVQTHGEGHETGISHARICSDTIMLAGCAVEGKDVVLAVRAYANPSVASVFAHAGMAWPVLSFLTGLLMLVFVLANRRLFKVAVVHPYMRADLTLTPMQEQLMNMFLESPNHTLTKEEICSALWPKKDNPDDTLYTFISRMKSSLARQSSSYRIENKRGKEYFLADEMDDNAR